MPSLKALFVIFDLLKTRHDSLIVDPSDALSSGKRRFDLALHMYVVLELSKGSLCCHFLAFYDLLQSHIAGIVAYAELFLAFPPTPRSETVRAASLLKDVQSLLFEGSSLVEEYLVDLIVQSDVLLLDC